MPFIDLNTSSNSFIIPPSDITIIGAGAAGILLALKLANQGKSIVVFESGSFGENDEKQQLNQVEQTGKILENAVWGRKRAIGGTTIAWGGQSLPFCSIDFKKRQWVMNSGWPISFDEMNKYYKEANSFMGIDTMNYSTDIFPKICIENPGIDASVFDFHVSKWAHQPDFFLAHRQELETKVTVFYNSHVTRLVYHTDRISSIDVANFKDTTFTYSVNTILICMGAIESTRLLLNNRIVPSASVGKGFMDHPSIEVGTIKPINSYDLQRKFNTHIWQGRKYSIRLSLTEKFQEDNKLLNCSASIMFQLPKESFDPYGELKAFKKDFKLTRLIKISGSVKSIVKTTSAYILHRFYFKPKTIAKLALMIEQEPLAESYIALSDQKDRFQIPKALIHWKISSKTWETAVKTSYALKKQIETLQLGDVHLFDGIREDTIEWNKYLSDVCHHMGGTKMGLTHEDSVVDKNLKVWGVANLYICSCSVFPTTSHSNPTLTMLALAVKLAEHLRKQ